MKEAIDVRHLARCLIESADSSMAKSSFTNWHVHGLDYACLMRTQQLTARIYVTRPDKLQLAGQYFDEITGLKSVVAPHDHAYSFHTVTLRGWHRDLRFEPVAGKAGWHERLFQSRVRTNKPTMQPLQAKPVSLKLLSDKLYVPGEGHFCSAKDVHTLVVPDDRITVLFSLQHQDEVDVTHLYLPDGADNVDFKGLYQPMSLETWHECVNLARDALSDTW